MLRGYGIAATHRPGLPRPPPAAGGVASPGLECV